MEVLFRAKSAIQAVSTSVSANASRVSASVSANATRVISEIKADLFTDRDLANRLSKEIESSPPASVREPQGYFLTSTKSHDEGTSMFRLRPPDECAHEENLWSNHAGGELPWIGRTEHEKNHEAEFRERILAISEHPEESLLKHHDEAQLIDMRAAMAAAGAILEADDRLRQLRFQLVPKKMKEHEFWRRYFLAVKKIKQDVLGREDEEPAPSPPRAPAPPDATSAAGEPTREQEEAGVAVAVLPSMMMRRLASAVEVGWSVGTMEDLSCVEGGGEKWRASIKQTMGAGLAALGALSGKERGERGGGDAKDQQMLLTSLFEAEAGQARRGGGHDRSAGASLIEEIHGAPVGSFVARLATALAGLKSGKEMALLWLEVVKELRSRWREGRPVPHLPVDAPPNLHTCLLNQHLQLLNCCMARRKRRHLAGGSGEAELGTAEAGVGRLGVLGPVAHLKLLESGEALCTPVSQVAAPPRPCSTSSPLTLLSQSVVEGGRAVQEGPVLTEEWIEESEDLILRTGSMGAGCSHLFSDMQAFKAANPGCILEDFVRWYSPPDWSEEPPTPLLSPPASPAAPPAPSILSHGAGGEPAEGSREEEGEGEGLKPPCALHRGFLSARMQAEGNLWQELWQSARAVPAARQTPLFDEELSGESALQALDEIAAADLLEQLFITALGVGFAAAMAALPLPLPLPFQEWRSVAVNTCSRGMGADELDSLCQVYEVMESAVRRLPEGAAGSPLRGQAVAVTPPGRGDSIDWDSATDASGESSGGSGRESRGEGRGEGEGEGEGDEGWASEEIEEKVKSDSGPRSYSSIGGEGWTIV